MEIRNNRSYELEIAATGQRVAPGETVEVDGDLGKALLEQPDNWGPVGLVVTDRPAESASKKVWVAYAVSTGMDEAEASKLTKADLVAQFPPAEEGERPDDAEPGEQIPGHTDPPLEPIAAEDDESTDDPVEAGDDEEQDR